MAATGMRSAAPRSAAPRMFSTLWGAAPPRVRGIAVPGHANFEEQCFAVLFLKKAQLPVLTGPR